MGLYSPIIIDTVTGYLAKEESFAIDFYLNNSGSDYNVFLRVVNPITGESCLKTGLKYCGAAGLKEGETNIYTVTLEKNDCVDDFWQPGESLQCALALTTQTPSGLSNYEYFFNSIEKEKVSAWSSSVIFSLVEEHVLVPEEESWEVEEGADYLFEGSINFKDDDFISWFSISYSGFDSGRLLAPKKNSFSFLFKTVEADLPFTLKYQTDKGYLKEKQYKLIPKPFAGSLMEPSLGIETSAENNLGFIKIEINLYNESDPVPSGILFVERTDSLSSFSKWEKIREIEILYTGDADRGVTVKDLCVNPTVFYKYRVYYKTLSDPAYTDWSSSNVVFLLPEDIFLAAGAKQLKIRYNPTLTGLKKNLSTSITPTLGAQFPFVQKNGKTNYRTFSIGGMISFHSEKDDKDSLFFQFDDDDVVYQELAHYEKEIIKERAFRDQVIDFLTDNNVKLFKSTPEGAMFIRLTDVSLSSEKVLGRNIYSFTATATEVAEFNVENCDKYINNGYYVTIDF